MIWLDAHGLCDLRVGETGEAAEQDDLGTVGIFDFELFEGEVEGKELIRVAAERDDCGGFGGIVEGSGCSAVFECGAFSSRVDEEVAHGLRSGVEEVRRTGEGLLPGEFDVDFVHKGGRLKGLTRGKLAQAMGRQRPQVVVDFLNEASSVVLRS